MRYREFKPSPLLSKYIECFWVLKSDSKAVSSAPQKILPDGCVELLFHFGDPVKRHISENKVIIPPRSYISGQIKSYLLIEPTGRMGTFGIRFRPWGAHAFWDLPIHELTEKVVDLRSIWGKQAEQIESIIFDSRTDRERLRALNRFLTNQLNLNYRIDPALKYALRNILRTEGQITIDCLTQNISISGRHLERKFHHIVGLTPKVFCRIIRYQRIFRIIEKNGLPKLTSVAFESGYYDQPHFIREFKEFSGQNPKAYFSQEHPVADFFTSKRRMSNLYNFTI